MVSPLPRSATELGKWLPVWPELPLLPGKSSATGGPDCNQLIFSLHLPISGIPLKTGPITEDGDGETLPKHPLGAPKGGKAGVN